MENIEHESYIKSNQKQGKNYATKTTVYEVEAEMAN